MPKDGQTRLGWDRFDGGIEMVPERAQPGQVLDARNVWAPYGIAERRPGRKYIALLTFSLQSSYSGTNPVTSVNNGDGTWTYTLVVDNAVRNPSLPALARLIGIGPPVLIHNGTQFTSMTLSAGPPLSQLDYTTRTFKATVHDGSAGVWTGEVFIYVGPAQPLLLAEIPWAGSYAVLAVYEAYDLNVPEYTVQMIAQVSNSGQLRGASSGGTNACFPNDVAFFAASITLPTAARISTVAPLPFIDYAYVSYNYTLYSLTSSEGFAVALSNSDPNFVGPRSGGVTPPYSVDVLSLLASPPRAGVVTYFAGHVFACNIADDPYAIRWSGPVASGAHNIWPAISFELVDEDGGRPWAAKPLSEFLVVYQSFNIYTLVADAPDALTGLATFDPKRVVSGVGTESHNSIVEVKGRHFFAARDGFYAFDGSPNVEKLSQPLDKFYRRLGRAAIAESRGVHWPEFHCVLWTVRQGAAADAYGQQLHYIILYDYAKNAWWIWDNILGGGGLARMFSGSAQAGIYMLSSIATLYRLTGNSDDVLTTIIDVFTAAPGGTSGDMPAAYLLTQRLGEAAYFSWGVEEVLVEAGTGTAQAEVTVIVDDDTTLDAQTKTVDFTNENDTLWGKAVWGKSNWQANRRRVVPGGHTGLVGKHVNLKIAAVNAFNRAWNIIRAAVYATKRFGDW